MFNKWFVIVAIVVIGLLAAIFILPRIDGPTIDYMSIPASAINFAKSAHEFQSFITQQNRGSPMNQGDHVSATIIAQFIGLPSGDNVCVSKGDFEDDTRFLFEDSEGSSIIYKERAPTWVKITALCGKGNTLQDSLIKNGITANWMTTLQCQAVAASEEASCIVALRMGG